MDILNHMGEEANIHSQGKKNLKAKNDDVEFGDEFLVEEYKSEGEEIGQSKRKAGKVSISSSSDDEDEEDKVDDEEEAALEICFCSRTHSQLSQFVKELRKTVFASGLKIFNLGSRKNLCINKDVLKLGNPARINERCLELQKNKKSEASKMKNLGAGVRRTKASCG